MIDRRSLLFALPLAAARDTEWLIDESAAARIERGSAAPGDALPPPGRTIPAGGDGGVQPVAVKGDGPGLRVLAPASPRVSGPFALHLEFVPRGHTADPSTFGLQVSVWTPAGYRGGEDLAPRLKRYATAEGLRMPAHRMPKRRYRFELRIADVTGRASIWRFEIEVTG